MRRLANAAGHGGGGTSAAREREYRAKIANHGTTDYQRNELRQMRYSVREKLNLAWKALSYSERGQDPGKLFKQFNTDNSGHLDVLEFRNAVRKAGQITQEMMSDKAIMRLFREMDTDGGGSVTVEDLTGFLWGASPASSPNVSRTASPDADFRSRSASRRENYAAAYEAAGVVAVGAVDSSQSDWGAGISTEEAFSQRMEMEMRFATLSEDDSGRLLRSPSPTMLSSHPASDLMDPSPEATSPQPPMQNWSPGSGGGGTGGGAGGESLLPSSGRSSPAVNRVSIDT